VELVCLVLGLVIGFLAGAIGMAAWIHWCFAG
jgi:hypothetical protein